MANIDLTKFVLKQFQPMLTDTHERQLYGGGRAGGKSVFALGQKVPLKLMSNPLINCVVFRQNEKDHQTSTYSEIKKGINSFADFIYKSTYEETKGKEEKKKEAALDQKNKFLAQWKYNTSPLKITFLPYGNHIVFRGFNDPTSIKSMVADKGYYCLLVLEEAQAVMKKEDFDFVDKSFRGKLPDGLFKQWMILFNSPLNTHWLREMFEDASVKVNFPKDRYINEKFNHYTYKSISLEAGTDTQSIAHYSVYTDNPYLSESDIKNYERNVERNPRQFAWEMLGEFGSTKGQVYDNWEVKDFDLGQVIRPEAWNKKSKFQILGGLDFGYQHPSAMYMAAINEEDKEMYIYDGFSMAGLKNRELAAQIISMGYSKERIICENAEPKTIEDLKDYGVRNIKAVHKYKGNESSSIMQGVKKVMEYKIYVKPHLKALIRGFSNYVWDEDKYGNSLERPIQVDDDEMDAIRYMVMWVEKNKFGFIYRR